jgi:hypothetical protein
MADPWIVLMKSEPMKPGNSVEEKTLRIKTKVFWIFKGTSLKYGKSWTKDNYNNIIEPV